MLAFEFPDPEINIGYVLPSTEVELDNDIYTVYCEAGVRGPDLAFGYEQPDGEVTLFQITGVGDKNSSREGLNEIDFSNTETLRDLIRIGRDIVKSANVEELHTLKKSWGKYMVMYQPNNAYVLSKSMHNQYLERVSRRSSLTH